MPFLDGVVRLACSSADPGSSGWNEPGTMTQLTAGQPGCGSAPGGLEQGKDAAGPGLQAHLGPEVVLQLPSVTVAGRGALTLGLGRGRVSN